MSENPDSTATRLYLDLMKRTLTNYVYGDVEMRAVGPRSALKRGFMNLIRKFDVHPMRRTPFEPELRRIGKDWPPTAHSMIGLERLNNLQDCCETAIKDGIPGDFIETGVWRGGASILMRAILEVHGDKARRVFVADSFKGLPPPDTDKYPEDAGSEFHTWEGLSISRAEVERNFDRYGLLDDQVQFLEGWFKDTLPVAPIEKLAVARLDGDLYESTMDALVHLYPKLSVGGYLIVDDYGAVVNCKKAIHDFRDEHGITEPLHEADWSCVYWRREA